MARIFLVALISALVWAQTVLAQQTNNDQYLRAFFQANDAENLKKKAILSRAISHIPTAC